MFRFSPPPFFLFFFFFFFFFAFLADGCHCLVRGFMGYTTTVKPPFCSEPTSFCLEMGRIIEPVPVCGGFGKTILLGCGLGSYRVGVGVGVGAIFLSREPPRVAIVSRENLFGKLISFRRQIPGKSKELDTSGKHLILERIPPRSRRARGRGPSTWCRCGP